MQGRREIRGQRFRRLRRFDDQDRTNRPTDDVFGNAAHQQAAPPREAMRPEDDQVAPEVGGRAQDGRNWVFFAEHVLDVDVCLRRSNAV